MTRPAKPPPAPPIAIGAWYALVRDGSTWFWATWWSSAPSADPWRTPDEHGELESTADPPSMAEAEIAATVERRIREARGASTLIRQLDRAWARAAEREASGRPPRFVPPAPTAKPPKYRRSRSQSSKAREELRFMTWTYWSICDMRARQGRPPPKPEYFGFDSPPPRPPEMGPEPERARVSTFHAGPCVEKSFAELGLEKSATEAEIARAYRRLVISKRLHPDLGGEAAQFIAITEAHDVARAHARRSALNHAGATP